MKAHSSESGDPVLAALESLVSDLEKNLDASRLAIESAERIKRLRTAGRLYREIVDETESPLVVELITENLDRLRSSGAVFRQVQAIALHEEGMTMEQIADIYGVSRQRVSALLRRGRRD